MINVGLGTFEKSEQEIGIRESMEKVSNLLKEEKTGFILKQ